MIRKRLLLKNILLRKKKTKKTGKIKWRLMLKDNLRRMNTTYSQESYILKSMIIYFLYQYGV